MRKLVYLLAACAALLPACGGGDHEVNCGNGRPLYGDQQIEYDKHCPNGPEDVKSPS